MAGKGSATVESRVRWTGGPMRSRQTWAPTSRPNRPADSRSATSAISSSGGARATISSTRRRTGRTPTRRPSASTTARSRVPGRAIGRRAAEIRSSSTPTTTGSMSRRPWTSPTRVRFEMRRCPVTAPARRRPPPPATPGRRGPRPSTVRHSRSRIRASPRRSRLAQVDALEDAQADGDADERGAAVRDERERDAGDGHDADDHTDIDQQLEEDHRRQAAREGQGEGILGPPAHEQDAPQEGHEEREDEQSADEAATAHRDLRLDEVVAGANGVGLRIEERQEAPPLVVEQHVRPDERQGGGGGSTEDEQPAQAGPGHEERADEDRAENDRCAEVGLHQHEDERGYHEHAGADDGGQAVQPGALAAGDS